MAWTHLIPRRAWSREHTLASEYRVRARQEAHGLLVLTQRLTTGRESDDRVRKDDACGCDRTQECLVLHRLSCGVSECNRSARKMRSAYNVILQRRSGDRNQCIDWKRLRMLWQAEWEKYGTISIRRSIGSSTREH
jgi:hypothetical protein